jgi:hypothetical protein
MKLSATAKTYLALLMGSLLFFPLSLLGGNPFVRHHSEMPPSPSADAKTIIAERARSCDAGFSQLCLALDNESEAPYLASNPELYTVTRAIEHNDNTGESHPAFFATAALSSLAKKYAVKGGNEGDWDRLGRSEDGWVGSADDVAVLALTDIHVTKIDYAEASHHNLAHVYWNAVPRYTNAYYALFANTPSSVDSKLRAVRYHAGLPTGPRMMTVSYESKPGHWVYDPYQVQSVLFSPPEELAKNITAITVVLVCMLIFAVFSLRFFFRGLRKILGFI